MSPGHPLLARLRAGDPALRRAACAAVAEDPSAVLLLEALAERLADDDADVARAAGDALIAIGERHGETDPILRAALRGDAPGARFEAARALAALAPPAPRLLPALVEALASPRPGVPWEAARLLVDAGRLDPEVVPIVTGLVHAAEDETTRRMAIFCLRELAPERDETRDALLAASRSETPALRRAALSALPAIALAHGPDDPASRDVRQRLNEAARSDPDPALRALAARGQGLASPAAGSNG